MKLCIGMASGAYGRDADRSEPEQSSAVKTRLGLFRLAHMNDGARERASVRSPFVFTPIERLSMSVSADHAPSLLEGSGAGSARPHRLRLPPAMARGNSPEKRLP